LDKPSRLRDREGLTGIPARFRDREGPPLKAMAGMSFGETAAARERVLLTPSAQAQGKPVGSAITQAKLANGLYIVVIPDRRAPVVTHMVWYRNGSADDPPGKSGMPLPRMTIPPISSASPRST
jgi:hypothetical protein